MTFALKVKLKGAIDLTREIFCNSSPARDCARRMLQEPAAANSERQV